MNYRFPHWKDASWNSYGRQHGRYDVLKHLLGTNAMGAELGVYKGGFGEFLLPHCRKLYLVDVWYRVGGFWKTDIPNDSKVQTVIDILTVYKDEIERGVVELVIDSAENFLATMPDGHFDFLYLDAAHDYKSTKRELEVARKKVRRGGHLIGDDYDPDPQSKQHGVFVAVNEMVASGAGTLVLNDSRQWGVRMNG